MISPDVDGDLPLWSRWSLNSAAGRHVSICDDMCRYPPMNNNNSHHNSFCGKTCSRNLAKLQTYPAGTNEFQFTAWHRIGPGLWSWKAIVACGFCTRFWLRTFGNLYCCSVNISIMVFLSYDIMLFSIVCSIFSIFSHLFPHFSLQRTSSFAPNNFSAPRPSMYGPVAMFDSAKDDFSPKDGMEKPWFPKGSDLQILVGGLEHFLFSYILGIIIPID